MKWFYMRTRFETEAQDQSRDIVSRQGKGNRGKWLSNLVEIFVLCFLLVILGVDPAQHLAKYDSFYVCSCNQPIGALRL